ncbi:HNH endonuclease [Jiella mangrovi]|uniref:Putative HNH nuclease YajD n=1 Tax=Jiella mangrovi TaxID=2821407 RepID=A0ABS4BC09_9HYPH|nr:HNH endonuclease signature motif containing protein [Jiella mangrovi]MBP0614288.1 HNH endonuclease [Jiella mangrovi]
MGVKTYKRAGADIYRTPRWKALRALAKRRDGYRCVQCGAAGDLEVDHIKPVRTHRELAFDLSNLQTLCVPCHSRKTRVEIGLAEIDPRRQAWRDLVNELTPKGGTQCSTV